MQLSQEVQKELMERFRALTPKEMQFLDNGIDQNAALVLLYNLIPEADSVLMGGLPALKDHQLDPNRLLHGAVTGQSEFVPNQGPEGAPPMPQEAPMGMPQEAPMGMPQGGALPMGMAQGDPMGMPQEDPMGMPQGALGGIPIAGA
tara:strand:- start:452 stop:889 length:438 start_codon:yes stop_codon:yes gene_type:complete